MVKIIFFCLLAGLLPELLAGGAEAPGPQLTVIAVGDIMLGNDFPTDRLPPQDGAGLLAEVAPILSAGELTLGNLEGVLLDGGHPVKPCRDPATCYLFRMPARYAAHLSRAGFDGLTLANNHARDFGEPGMASTVRALEAAGIRHAGLRGDIASWDINGRRVTLVAFGYSPHCYSLLDLPAAATTVRYYKASSDILIVSFHGGAEGGQAVRVTGRMETGFGERRGDVRAFARAVVEAGADLVIGHGPHVPRGVERHRQRLIVYSLGNFCTYEGISIAGISGLAPILEARLNGDGSLAEARIISCVQSRPEGTRIDPQGRAADLMRTLTSLIPGAGAEIGVDGVVRPLN